MSLTMDDLNKAENDIEKVCIEANRDCHKCIFSKNTIASFFPDLGCHRHWEL